MKDGWISDDISFCMNDKCRDRSCFRHPKNIRIPYILHSFAYFENTDE